MKTFSIIVAMDKKSGIGKAGDLPWHIPEDLKRFKELTMLPHSSGKPNALIMGRKTWESLPQHVRPLPGRVNVVLSKDRGLQLPSGVRHFVDLEGALGQMCSEPEGCGHVFVIGGGQVFAEAIGHPLCSQISVTRIDNDFDCDVFFPCIPKSFRLTEEREIVTKLDSKVAIENYLKA